MAVRLGEGADVAEMLAVYDFAESQISCDFFTFLALADLARREADSARLHILLVPGHGDGFREDVPYDLMQKHWRVRNLIVDGASLLPSCTGVLQAASREHACALVAAHTGPIFPPNYSVDAPTDPEKPGYLVIKANYGDDIQVLRASSQARIYAQQWLDARRQGRKAIALTLRESSYGEERNHAIAPWGDFARYLKERGYFPFILRDISMALDVPMPVFEGIADCPAAVFNIDLRMALYELSYLNVFAFNGPMWISCFSRQVRFIGFPVGSVAKVNGFYEFSGAEYGETLPVLNRLQRFVWHEPELPAMIDAFEAMALRLQQHDAAGCPAEDYELDPAYRRPAHVIGRHFLNVRMWSVLEALFSEAKRHGETTPELNDLYIEATRERLNLVIDEEQYRRAVARRFEGDHKGAIELLEQLLKRRPTEVEVYLELGMAYETIDRIQDADALYRSAISQKVVSSYLLYRLGCIAQSQGNLDDAQACFETVIARDEPGDQNIPHARRRLTDMADLFAGNTAEKS